MPLSHQVYFYIFFNSAVIKALFLLVKSTLRSLRNLQSCIIILYKIHLYNISYPFNLYNAIYANMLNILNDIVSS